MKKVKDTGIIATLRPQQMEGLNFLSEWLGNREERAAILAGFAGTGKTYCCRAFAEVYSHEVFLFTAPTNKATQVLQLSLGEEMDVRTTYSILGLRPNSGSAEQELIQTLSAAQIARLRSITVLVVDEASMVGERKEVEEGNETWEDMEWDEEKRAGELLDFIKDASELYNFKVLYLGDELQLPPPSSEAGESPVFYQDYPIFHLTDVRRHKGVILNFVMAIRKSLNNKTHVFPLPVKYDIPYLRFYSKKDLEEDLPSYLDGTLKMIAFTNATVDKFNSLVRETHYGEGNVQELQEGDRVMFIKPLINLGILKDLKMENPLDNPVGWEKDANFKIVASIDSQAEVVSVTPKMVYGVPVYETEVRIDNGVNAIVYFLGEVSQKPLQDILDTLKDYTGAAAYSKDGMRTLNHFRETFMPIKFAYAFTSHRSQGSNFSRVIMDAGDIMKMTPIRSAMRSAHVAASRAMTELRVLWRL